jgi:hypothetical protein
VNDCTISGNSAGVGIFNFGKPGPATMTINNSTISGNSGGIGGGIYNNGNTGGSATLTVTNSTISGNSASFLGGGIYNSGGAGGSATLTVTNSTISGNSADISGGGIFNDGGTLNLNSSIVANSAGGDGERGAGTVNAQYSLIEDSSIGFVNGTNTGNVSGQDPMLGPLKDNGGPTFTHELLTGSAAINAGDPNFTPPPDFDQRGTGFPRVVNNRIDIGAFEVQIATPSYAGQIQQPIDADGSSVFNVRRGVVPMKFTLTLNGVATCDLPPATIAVARTAGGTPGPVDELVYTGSADNGSNFRIDSCQYIYNLSASALGLGTYRVDIMINGQVVGSGMFQLK